MRSLALYIALAIPALCLQGLYEPSERALRLLTGIRNAWRRQGMSDKEAAAVMDVEPTLLARQLIGRDGTHLSVGRVGELPDVVLLNVAETICDLTGQARLIRDEKLDALMRTLETLDGYALRGDAAERKRTA